MILTADERKLLSNIETQNFLPLRSVVAAFKKAQNPCPTCAKLMPIVASGLMTAVRVLKSNEIFQQHIKHLFNTQTPNIRGL